MSEFPDPVCVLDAIMVSNGNDAEDPAQPEAASLVNKTLRSASRLGLSRLVRCDRCDTTFSVGLTGAVDLADKKLKCDGPVDISENTDPGAYLIDINFARLVEAD